MPAEPDSPHRRLDLVVHIGSGKTGTSSLQAFLRVNRAMLAEHGVLFPRSPGDRRHTRFGVYITPDEALSANGDWRRMEHSSPSTFRDEFGRALFDEIRDSGLSTLLISDEGLYGAPEATIAGLRRFADAHAERLRLVCYLRRQDDHLVSRYQQVVKMGEVRKLAERTEQLDLSKTYDYARRLDTWERVADPAAFVVRRFEPDRLLDGSLYRDFLAASDLPLPSGAMTPVPTQNESLDAESVEFLRILNLYRVRHQGARAGVIRNRRLVVRLAAAGTGPTLTLPPAVLDRFMEQWEPGNRIVARRWFGEEDGVLFRSPRKTSNTTTRQRLDPSRLDHFLEVTELPPRLHRPLRELVEEEAR